MIGPEEFADWADKNIDPLCDQSIISASDKLYELNQNKSFIIESICEKMMLLSSGSLNASSSQSTLHAARRNKNGSIVVRSVLWTPRTNVSDRARLLQDSVLTYSLPHDHNFSLLTIGHWGPGYTTEIFEYRNEEIVGYEGELVDIKFKEKVKLSEDKILFFKANNDIHTQFYPDDVSISLNVMVIENDAELKPQYVFDTEKGLIKGILQGHKISQLYGVFDMVDVLGFDEKMIELSTQILKTHPSDHIRNRALQSIAKVTESTDFWKKISLENESKLVRKTAEKLLNNL
jgi:hypothetical protein